jgi:hypothetical protein
MILPRYYLERVYLPTATPGSWYDQDEKTLICKTLELPWRNNAISADYLKASCIAEGVYLFMFQEATPSRKYDHYRCMHAPGRHWHPEIKASSILVHTGNYTEHLLGCIAPGSRHLDINGDGVIDVADSTKKLLWMTQNLPKFFELEIRQKRQ